MKTISILSQKGGSGKTTSTLALAGAAHAQGKTVVVLDIDPQAAAKVLPSCSGWVTQLCCANAHPNDHATPEQLGNTFAINASVRQTFRQNGGPNDRLQFETSGSGNVQLPSMTS